MYDGYDDFSETSSMVMTEGKKSMLKKKQQEVKIVDVAKEYEFYKLFGGYFKNKK